MVRKRNGLPLGRPRFRSTFSGKAHWEILDQSHSLVPSYLTGVSYGKIGGKSSRYANVILEQKRI